MSTTTKTALAGLLAALLALFASTGIANAGGPASLATALDTSKVANAALTHVGYRRYYKRRYYRRRYLRRRYRRRHYRRRYYRPYYGGYYRRRYYRRHYHRPRFRIRFGYGRLHW